MIRTVVCLVVLLLFACDADTKSPTPTTPDLTPIPFGENPELLFIEELPERDLDPQPIIVVLHGYGSNERDLISLGKSLSPDFFIVGVRAPNDVGTDRFSWYPIGQEDPQAREAAAAEVLRVIRELPRTGIAQGKKSPDQSKLYLAGFSQGGAVALETAKIATAADGVTGVLAFSPALFDYDSATVPAFVSHGTRDKVVPFAPISDRVSRHEAIEFLTFDGEHQIPRNVVEQARTWLQKTL